MGFVKGYRTPAFFYVLLLLIAAGAFGVMLYATAPGLGVSPDSVFYFAGAESLRTGDGYSFPDGIGDPEPITHFPPFYSLLLAVLSLSGFSVMECARLLQAFLYAGSGVLLGVLLYRGTKQDPLLSAAGTALFLVIEDLVLFQTFLQTEGLYYFLTLLGISLLVCTVQSRKWLFLILAASTAGLAFLTRYAGLANVVTGIAVIVLYSKGWREKVRRGVVFSSIGGILPGLVFLWSSSRPGVVSYRGFFYHPLRLVELKASLDDIAIWLLPGRLLGTWIQWAILAALFVLTGFLFIRAAILLARGKILSQNADWAISGFFILFYFGLLLSTVLFVDAQAGLGSRLLSPLFAPILLFFLGSGRSITVWKSIRLSHLLLVVLLPVIVFNSVHTLNFVQKSHTGSRKEYNGKSWQQAEIIHWLDNLPEGTPVYSNGNDAVYFVSRRPCARLPYKYSPFTLQDNPDYEAQMEEMEEVLKQGGVVLYFPAIKWRGYLVSLEELQERFELQILFENESGPIFGLVEQGGVDP
ncbi:MAG: hypothetical protein JXA25_20800 [Anaerolineales bacterium]|nr:hypothetical protein [Anaerolineales bacterium]